MSERIGTLSFEEAVRRLEEIVAEMEGGALTLDDCLRRFEEAVALSRHCAETLERAERQITVLEAEGYLRTAVEIPGATEEEHE